MLIVTISNLVRKFKSFVIAKARQAPAEKRATRILVGPRSKSITGNSLRRGGLLPPLYRPLRGDTRGMDGRISREERRQKCPSHPSPFPSLLSDLSLPCIMK